MLRRRRAEVVGRVQGVGFRPYVHRLATGFGLGGQVWNDAAGATVEVEGDPQSLRAFADALVLGPLPPLARIDTIGWSDLPVGGDAGFRVSAAVATGCGAPADGLADVGPCAVCVAEFDNPADRRWRYPFTCCTDCGPRLTLALPGPWARANTVMERFALCGACKAEFDSPSNRRFQAETISCPDCGPTLAYRSALGVERGMAALDAVCRDLCDGGVALVKGVGGYHLMGRADLVEVVAAMRRVKGRDVKPMALLVADASAAMELMEVDDASALALESSGRPIVLAPRRAGVVVQDGVTDRDDLGVVVSPSLLHLEVARRVGVPLVFTSANPSGAPTVVDDDEARDLSIHADISCFVTHDRPITKRADDSVVRSMGGRCLAVRSGRGDAMAVRHLVASAGRPVLGVGGHLKSTVSLAVGDHLYTSPHIGDLDHPEARAAWERAIEELTSFVRVQPELVVTDRHPDYASSLWASELGIETRTVQHHHAHAAAALAEHAHVGPSVAVVLDGHGWGDDGTSWGGEVLVVDDGHAHRMSHLLPVALPGGSAAIRDPWRMAVAWLADDPVAARRVAELWQGDGDAVLEVCRWSTTSRATTTSAGRLIDALAAIVGVAGTNRFEGDAAMGLEGLASACASSDLAYDVELDQGVLDPRELLAQVTRDVSSGVDRADIARAALVAIAAGFARAAVEVATDSGIAAVVISGGVVQNRIVDSVLRTDLSRAGLVVLGHERVPANDAGLSVGQAVVGAGCV